MSTVTELSPSAKSAVTVAVMLAAIMQVLDTTIANVAANAGVATTATVPFATFGFAFVSVLFNDVLIRRVH